MALLSINWNPDPVLFELGGISIRYYGLLWVIGLALAYLMVHKIFRDKKIPDETFDPLFFYCLVGIVAGARLGHCLFYEPGYYLHNITEMLLPIKYLPDGNWKFTGYQGLASHGGSIGAILALVLYSRKYKIRLIELLDIVGIATPIVACFIRLANLMNSEIIGRPTDVAWAFVFENVDMVPRHPAQLYEALFYLSVFVVLFLFYKFWNTKVREGFYFGYLLTSIFTFRFLIEFLKEDQVAFEEGMSFNMGQLLSIPFILTGIYFMFFLKTKDAK